MLKHTLSPAHEPQRKRPRLDHDGESSRSYSRPLSEELMMYIFSYLSAQQLCSMQLISHDWSRLASDNHLWKSLYIHEFGRRRLRGATGFITRTDGRQTRALPGRAKIEDHHKQWKWMFRTSTNWRKGRCSVDIIPRAPEEAALIHVLFAGPMVVAASSHPSPSPQIVLHGSGNQTLCFPALPPPQQPTNTTAKSITCLALDQSPPSADSDHSTQRLAIFLSSGEFAIFTLNHSHLERTQRTLTFVPAQNGRTTPIVRAAYHHPLLITLSSSFSLSIYDMSGNTVRHTQTLTSFTSFPPSSLVLSGPNANSSAFKLILTYASPVYPRHFSVGATELIISIDCTGIEPVQVTSTRSTKTVDTPQGWIDEKKLQMMRDQWNRKVAGVAACETDGKWVVLASTPFPDTSCEADDARVGRREQTTSLQLYRLSRPSMPSGSSSLPSPKLTFVRMLEGPPTTTPIDALYLADGRCVSLGRDGSIWVWDLEAGVCAPVAAPQGTVHASPGQVAFDDRRLVCSGNGCVTVRRFDV